MGRRSTGPSSAAVQLVLGRAGLHCERCGSPLTGERGYGWSIHHRRGRDDRPDSHSTQNLVVVCGGDNVTGCHGWCHSRRSESQPAGFWLSRIAGTDPLLEPFLLHGEEWLYLTADGGYSDSPPGVG